MEVREMAMAAAAAAAASTGGGGVGGGGGGAKLPPPNPNLPYREDCWSDGETAALVSAWGSRYVELNRGNLRQKQWQEVADAVNSRRGASARRRPPRTDVQCKNRVDTLKKKYKAELARNAPSGWSFFHELDRLVGPTLSANAARRPSPSTAAPQFALPAHPPAIRKPPSPSLSPSPPPPMALPLPNYRRGLPLPAAALIQKEAAAAAAAMSDSENSDDAGGNRNHNSQHSPSRSVSSLSGNNNKKRSRHEAGSSGDKGFRELARAIEAFAEMYERVENAKQKHALEMERQRIDFLKQLEVKRMENFVDAHVKLVKAKRSKKGAGSGGAADGAAGVDLVATVASLPFVSGATFH